MYSTEMSRHATCVREYTSAECHCRVVPPNQVQEETEETLPRHQYGEGCSC